MFEVLKMAMLKKHHSQNDLAGFLGLSATAVSRRFNGATAWRDDEINRLAKLYRVPKYAFKKK